MNSVIAPLLLLLSLQSVEDVDEGLQAIEEGRRLGNVPVKVGQEAVKRIRPTTSASEVEGLVKLALAANVRYTLDAKLKTLIVERGAGAWVAARTLAAFPERRRADLLERVPKKWAPELIRMLRRQTDAETDAAIATLLLPRIGMKSLAELVDRWRHRPRLNTILARLGLCPKKRYPTVFKLLLEQRFREEHAAALRIAYRSLAPHPKVAKAIAEQLQRRQRGPYDAFLHAAPGLPPELWKSVERTVLSRLETDDPQDRAAAIRIAAELLCHQLLDELPDLYSREEEETGIRVAAVEALGHVGYRDAPTIDRLIALLADKQKEVAQAAYRVLLRKAALKIKLPLRKKDWLVWRQTVTLPDEPEEGPEERLAKMRKQRQAQFLIVNRELYPPPTPKKPKKKPRPKKGDDDDDDDDSGDA